MLGLAVGIVSVPLQKGAKVMVMGDSHVRRLESWSCIIDRKCREGAMDISFYHRGGARLDFVERNLDHAIGCDMLVIMVGGNDLASGIPQNSLVAAYDRITRRALELGIRAVVITSVWPRRDYRFNQRAMHLSQALYDHYLPVERVMFWHWDRRQSFKTYDGVHLEQKGYKKAVTYLLAAILWGVKHLM